jgi:hypothetical protein
MPDTEIATLEDVKTKKLLALFTQSVEEWKPDDKPFDKEEFIKQAEAVRKTFADEATKGIYQTLEKYAVAENEDTLFIKIKKIDLKALQDNKPEE